jgi:RNA polymerase sigma factor (sigma-70 family)
MDSSGFSIDRLQELDEAEWGRLQEEFFPRIFFYCKKQVQEHQTAEDLTQEVFLGAVRGIGNFDPQYTLEQFLFGIARNRVIDHFRKKRPIPMSGGDDGANNSYVGIERMASERRSPDQSAVALESANVRRDALAKALRMLVGEYWEKGDFEKLKVVEYLFALGGATRRRLGVSTSRTRRRSPASSFARSNACAASRGSSTPNTICSKGSGSQERAEMSDSEKNEAEMSDESIDPASTPERTEQLVVTVGQVWRDARVSCPHRDVLNAFLEGGLPEDAASYIRFHIDEAECPYCAAHVEDLRRLELEASRKTLESVKDRLLESTSLELLKVKGARGKKR